MSFGRLESAIIKSGVGLIILALLLLAVEHYAHAVMCGQSDCVSHVGSGINQDEFKNNNKNGQACGGADVVECEILAEIHNDFDTLFGLISQLITAENQNTAELKIIASELKK